MNKEQKFLSEIAEILKSHQEEYIPGAWEEFSHEKRIKRKIVLLWRWTGAAAVLLLLAYSSFEFFSTETLPEQARIIKRSNHELKTIDTLITEVDEEQSLIKLHKTETIKKGIYSSRQMQEKATENTDVLVDIKMSEKYTANEIDDDSPIQVIMGKVDVNDSLTLVDTGIAKSLPKETSVKSRPLAKVSDYTKDNEVPTFNNSTNLTKEDIDEAKKRDSKTFVYSLVLSPSIGNQKLNLGTGLEVSYHIDNNISFSGGIMYSSLHAEKSLNESGGGNKKLQNVELAISGFEAPIRLQYETKGGLYLTAGLSGMSVTNDRLAYNYITQTTQIITELSHGVPREAVRVVSQESKEQSQEKVRNYIGFYTFSAGTKKAFGSKYINIGPFVKIPFGSISSEEIKLMQGGFRISLDF